MEDTEAKISRIERLLRNRGFRPDSTGIERKFNWKPDIVVSNDAETRAFLVRESDSIPIVLVERLASTKSEKRNLFISVVFVNKAPKGIKTLALYGVGIQHLSGTRLEEIAKSKNF